MDANYMTDGKGNTQHYLKTTEPPATPPPALRLTLEERLTLENLALKVENLRLQQERMKQDFVLSAKMLVELRKEAHETEMELKKKYGVDLANSTIQPDGLIVPKGTEQAPSSGDLR